MNRVARVSLAVLLLANVTIAGASARASGGAGGVRAGFASIKITTMRSDPTKCYVYLWWDNLKTNQSLYFSTREMLIQFAGFGSTAIPSTGSNDYGPINKMYVSGFQVALFGDTWAPILDASGNPALTTVKNTCV